jgi:hypothetical protein
MEEDPRVAGDSGESGGKDNRRVIGVSLLILGGLFLAGNLAGVAFQNWWALFLLIPAMGSLATAYRRFQHREMAEARRILWMGLFLVGLLLALVFGLDFGFLLPLLLLLIGVGALLGVFLS